MSSLGDANDALLPRDPFPISPLTGSFAMTGVPLLFDPQKQKKNICSPVPRGFLIFFSIPTGRHPRMKTPLSLLSLFFLAFRYRLFTDYLSPPFSFDRRISIAEEANLT